MGYDLDRGARTDQWVHGTLITTGDSIRSNPGLQGAIGTDPARRPMKTLSTCNPGFERI